MGYSPWGRTESDTTERLHFHFNITNKVVCVLVAQSCLTLCDPMDCTGSSVHGILQEGILEWATIPFPQIR